MKDLKSFITKIIWLYTGILLCYTNISYAAQVTKYVLDNGLNLILIEDPSSPIAIGQLWYKVGSGYERPSQTGVTYLLKEIASRSILNSPQSTLKKLIFSKGGSCKSHTSIDYTVYYQVVPFKELELVLKLNSDYMNNVLLNEELFKKEKKHIVEQRLLDEAINYSAVVKDRFYAAAYPGSGYHSPLKGWLNDVEELQIKDLRAWYKQWYVPNNAILIIAGNINKTETYNLVQQYFGKIPAKHFNTTLARSGLSTLGHRRVEAKLPVKVPRLFMGYNVPSLNTAQNKWEPYALELLAAILSEGYTSRLAKNLINSNSPVAFEATASYNPFRKHATTLFFSAIPSKNKTLPVLEEAILYQLKILSSNLVSDRELNKVKNKILLKKIYDQDSLFNVAYKIGRLEAAGYPLEIMEQRIKEISSITAQQIREVAKKYLIKDGLTVAYLVPDHFVNKMSIKK